jgi:hypothetical protein
MNCARRSVRNLFRSNAARTFIVGGIHVLPIPLTAGFAFQSGSFVESESGQFV